ncbi:hypothetical protein T4C_12448 [Trichinella pseudospiralis]|uniref:Uncharacterized protein n=1 Tax=Trichinella pseudospiralis TaxID=6337 RepID=A0A0V1KD98_TRIPS|nr:hypothetical protein T4C_12448 [Trichinella pseudospiralis]
MVSFRTTENGVDQKDECNGEANRSTSNGSCGHMIPESMVSLATGEYMPGSAGRALPD